VSRTKPAKRKPQKLGPSEGIFVGEPKWSSRFTRVFAPFSGYFFPQVQRNVSLDLACGELTSSLRSSLEPLRGVSRS